MEGAGEAGVVYVSLGTVCSIGEGELRELAAALSGVPTRVIWKVGAGDLPEGLTIAALGLGANIKARLFDPSLNARVLVGSGALLAGASLWFQVA